MLSTGPEVLNFVAEHGVVLLTARGRLPSLVEVIAGERIAGSLAASPHRRRVEYLLQALEDSGQVITCRLLGGKVTVVHRRLWAALVRLEERLGDRVQVLAQEREADGRLRTDVRRLRDVVRAADLKRAESLSEGEAWSMLADVLDGDTRVGMM